MPILEFALDATGTNRVQTFWEVGKGNLTILINGSMIGSISQEELVGGRAVPLADLDILLLFPLIQGFGAIRRAQEAQAVQREG